MAKTLTWGGGDPEQHRRIDETCDTFEAEYLAGRQPLIEDYLTRLAAPDRPHLLRELLAVELHYQRKVGKAPTADEYRARFPEYAGVVVALFAVPAASPTVTFPETVANGDSPAPSIQLPEVPGYEILCVLGSGGMGDVYKARHLRLNRLVALKVVRGGALAGADRLARFRKEAEATARLKHTHVVLIYDYGEASGFPYLALDLIDGGSLSEKLARDGKFAPRAAAELVRNLSDAVAAAHDKNIVHRDLKPANVLLDGRGEPKVADFGLAKMTDNPDGLTVDGSVFGTPAYMAPEQACGDTKNADKPAVDIYALGVILFELLTGRRPFAAESDLALLRKVEREQPPLPRSLNPAVPRDLEAICLMCLEKQPGDRYQSASALAEDLTLYLENKPLKYARRIGPLGRLRRRCRRNPWTAGLSALFAVAALGLVTFAARDNSYTRIRWSGKFAVAVDPIGPPYSLWDKDGKTAGIDVELAQEIANRLGVKLDHHKVVWDWDDLVGQLNDRKIDAVISCVSITEGRKQQVAFVEYARDPFVFATRRGTKILSRDDLTGKELVVQRGTTAEQAAEQLKAKVGGLTIIRGQLVPDTFRLVRETEGRVLLEHELIVRYHAGPPDPLESSPAAPIAPALADQRIGIALRRDAHELRRAVEKVMRDMEVDGALDAIIGKFHKK